MSLEEQKETTIPWSEMTYHFFSWLIDKETPRELAQGIELQIFKNTFVPNQNLLDTYVASLELSQDEPDFVYSAVQIYNANRVFRQKEIHIRRLDENSPYIVTFV